MMASDIDNVLTEEFRSRYLALKESLAEVCTGCGRDPEEVTVIGVSKVFPVEYAKAAFKAGIKDLGENRVQELVPKTEAFLEDGLDANWHLIGTLQKNKVKYIIGKTHLIHSVDSIELAEEIAKRSICNNVISDILLQVNVSGEESKHGFSVDAVRDAVPQLAAVEGIRVKGLMTMAPIQSVDGDAKSVFENTKRLYDEINPGDWDVLSMGMSGDWRYAVMCGATHIRIGTALFGDRAAYAAKA